MRLIFLLCYLICNWFLAGATQIHCAQKSSAYIIESSKVESSWSASHSNGAMPLPNKYIEEEIIEEDSQPIAKYRPTLLFKELAETLSNLSFQCKVTAAGKPLFVFYKIYLRICVLLI